MNRSCIQRFVLTAVAAFLAVESGSPLFAQVRKRPPSVSRLRKRPTTTIVKFVLVTGKQGMGIQAQQWGLILQKLGVSFRIRRGTAADKLETRETKFGALRQVTVIGQLDSRGRLLFADRSFTRGDAGKLAEWVRELKAYGAQGSPGGKALWGLSKAQFGEVFSSLSLNVKTNVDGMPLKSALTRINLPAKFPVRFSLAARRWLRTAFPKLPAVRKEIHGQSVGSAFALILHDYGLGFRPLRTPRGSIELVIDPMSKVKAVWPIGWKLKNSRPQTAPKLFKLIRIELRDVLVTDVLHAVSVKTGVPVHYDHFAIARKGIDVSKLKVSYGPRQASWSQLLNHATVPHRLSRIYRIDERGQPFVWITTLTAGRSQ